MLSTANGHLDNDVVICLDEGIHDASQSIAFTAEHSVTSGEGEPRTVKK